MAKRRWLVPLALLAGAVLYREWRRGTLPEIAEKKLRCYMPSPGVYDFWARLAMGGLYDKIARQVAEVRSEGSVLDVGCGPGWLDIRLAEIAPRLEITGVDVESGMVERATTHAMEAGVTDRVHFEVGDVGRLPFPDERFDLVASSLSLHHWPDPALGLAEIFRVLKPGGEARIYDIPDSLQRLTHHGPGVGLAQLAASSPFQGGVVLTLRWPWRLPIAQCLVLGRPA